MSSTLPRNSLQAILERQAAAVPQPPPAPAKPGRSKSDRGDIGLAAEISHGLNDPAASAEGPAKFYRPSRAGRRLIAGHFDPAVARQLKLLAAEDDTTVQALLEEALELLFVKKGKATLIRT